MRFFTLSGRRRSYDREATVLQSRIRVEQLDVALRLAPFTIAVSLSVVQVITYLFWASEHRLYLSILQLLLLPVAAMALVMCWRWSRQPKPESVSHRFTTCVTTTAFAYGSLLATIPVLLFPSADSPLRLLIAATCAGLIATGMSVSVSPRIALNYSVPIIIGSFGGLALTGENFYIYVGILLLFYAGFIIFTIINMSRLLTLRVMTQADLEKQKEFTDLLLNDFEENANDWLWETDSKLRLQHVSTRLIAVCGLSERQLQGSSLKSLFSISKNASLSELWAQIKNHRSFRNVLIHFQMSGEERWWLLSGKPILDHRGEFTGYRGVGSDITERKRSEERLSYLAMHDALTELPNRLLFERELKSSIDELRELERLAVFYLDLDEFKSVNDTFGHAAGDTLLQSAAARLDSTCHAQGLVARLAGDEFAVLLRGPAACSREKLSELATQIVQSLAEPFEINAIQISIGVSIGIAIAPLDGSQEIMRRADLAMYRMKSEGRNGFRFYEAEMDHWIESQRSLMEDLACALDRREFCLHFQPLIHAAENRIQGFEALVRWKHPTLGFVSPAEFIPLAERSGVIITLGEWIIRQACKIAASWPGQLTVAVNLSPIQFRHSDVGGIVSSALRESGLTPERLELEVTETVFLEATATVHAMLGTLRGMGVRLSLDDFGTGYSSLSYLRRIPFDKIKIDQSFVRELPQDESNLAIVRTIVDLGKSLNMTITAEGVETEAQRLCLLQQGCHQFQGYLFGKPMPENEITMLLSCETEKTKAA